jgi:hypothetical protein
MEKVTDAEGIQVSLGTVRRILRAEGTLLQVDGSPHDWLEGRGCT